MQRIPAVSLVAADQLCFTVLVDHLDPPALAHIHQGPAGANGPIVVNLAPPPFGERSASAGWYGRAFVRSLHSGAASTTGKAIG
jgi:hypothetical protein